VQFIGLHKELIYSNNYVFFIIGGAMRKGLFFTLYMIILHIILLVLVVKTNAIELFGQKFFNQPQKIDIRYRNTHAFYLRMDKNLTANKTIFIGDSHVQGLAVIEVSSMSVNFGIGKDTTDGLTDRISDYDSILSAKTIVIAIGINDLQHKSVKETVIGFRKLLRQLPNDSLVLVNGVFVIDEEKFQGQISNKDILLLNTELKRIVNKRSNSYFLDINPQLAYDGQLIEEYHIGDGIHLSEKGYHIWIKALTQTLNNLERQ
jgi:lysophospholipase L1-like esterase